MLKLFLGSCWTGNRCGKCQ